MVFASPNGRVRLPEQWLRVWLRSGRRAYGVPSRSRPGLWHVVTWDRCSCEAFKFGQGNCWHIEQVRSFVATVRAR